MAKICPRCELEAAPLDSYCPDCGTELETVWKYRCLACGHNFSYLTKFCTQCGIPYSLKGVVCNGG